jgi:CMP/dCMP kinase
MHKRIVIAIDGPGGAGKSTVAKAVAERLGFIYIDTGAMYRAVALWARQAGVDSADHHKLEQLAREADIQFEPGARTVYLNGGDVTAAIRGEGMDDAASTVSKVPGVRRALVDKQRALAAETSVVMEGRDIGTVVFPQADVKIFLDAPAEVRATRRTSERNGSDAGRIASQLAERDARDIHRAVSPLVQAPDALYIDSGPLSVPEVVEAIIKVVRERTANGKEYSR